MKGSDIVKMTINLGGELIKLDVNFDDQIAVRDTERDIKKYIDHLKKSWPDNSDRNILAMALYQFARWCHQLKLAQEDKIQLATEKSKEIDSLLNNESNSIALEN